MGSLHHRSARVRGPPQQTAVCCHRRHVPGYCQEGQTRAEEEGDTSCSGPTEESLPAEEWTVHLLRRQCRRDSERQGGDEGISNNGSSSQRMCRLLAEDSKQRGECRLI